MTLTYATVSKGLYSDRLRYIKCANHLVASRADELPGQYGNATFPWLVVSSGRSKVDTIAVHCVGNT